MRTVKQITAAAWISCVLTVITVSCSKDEPTDPGDGDQNNFDEVAVTADVPSQSPLGNTRLTVMSSVDQVDLDAGSSATILTEKATKPQLVMVAIASSSSKSLSDNAPENVMLIGIVYPGDTALVISAKSTAKALLLLNPLLMGSSGEQRETILDKAETFPEFDSLVSKIESVLVVDPNSVLDESQNPDIFEDAINLFILTLGSFGSQKTGKAADPEEIGVYVEDRTGDKIAIMNSRTICYAAGILPEGACDYVVRPVFIDAKDSWLRFELAWPPVLFAYPTETEIQLPNGWYNIEITRGFHLSRANEFFNPNTPFGIASMGNTLILVRRIADLALGGILNVPIKNVDMSKFADINTGRKLCEKLQSGDIIGLFFVTIDYMGRHAEAFARLIWGENVSTAKINHFKRISSVAKKITFVMDAIESIAYSYDLVTSPLDIGYSIELHSNNLATNNENFAPDPPYFSTSQSQGDAGVPVKFAAVTHDPDDHEIVYQFDWGDETDTWSDFVPSGANAPVTHVYSSPGIYTVKVRAKDAYGPPKCWSSQRPDITIIEPQGDAMPPSPITDLAASEPTQSSVTLTWSAPGDDGSTGIAAQYDIRYSSTPITEYNWSSATQVSGEPSPKPAGGAETFVVTSLSPNSTYYFAIKAADEVPNWSLLSNIAADTTLPSQASDGKIVFISDRDGDYCLYIMNPDGSNVTKLLCDFIGMRISRDESMIAFKRETMGREDLYVKALYGGNELNLTASLSFEDLGGHFSWSPDNSTIALNVENTAVNEDIYVVTYDGSMVRNLTQTENLWETRPEWSPDGTKIAISAAALGWGIYTIDSSGGNLTLIADTENADFSAIWSPDGARLAFEGLDDQYDYHLYVVNASGQGLWHVSNKLIGFSWSPSSAEVIFSNKVDGDAEIFLADANNRSIKRLTENSVNDAVASFSPGGDRITFTSDRSGDFEVYTMTALGTNLTRLTYNAGLDIPVGWLSGNGSHHSVEESLKRIQADVPR